MSFNTCRDVKKHGADRSFQTRFKMVSETSQFSPFHFCKLDIQELLGKISLSVTNRKHMCREYTGETVQEHVILGETLFM